MRSSRLACAAAASLATLSLATGLQAQGAAVALEELLAKPADYAGKQVSTVCTLMLADDSMGSMCAVKGKGNIMIDAKTWTPEAKALVMGECHHVKAEKFCEVVVSGTVEPSGSTLKIKGASVKKK